MKLYKISELLDIFIEGVIFLGLSVGVLVLAAWALGFLCK